MGTTKLRLHRDPESVEASRADEIPATFRFPVIPRGRGGGGRGLAHRMTLVAGRVDPGEATGSPPHADRAVPRPAPLRLMHEDGSVTTPDLIQQVEQTLEAMQARLDRLRRQAESPMRFPQPVPDPDRPTAA